MRITDLIIDSRSLGSKFWLVEVLSSYEYKDGKRTDNISAYRYVIALPEKGLEKVNVKIEGKQLLDAPKGYAEVNFNALEVFIYWSGGDYQVGAKAKGISLANVKQ